eukprot:355237-Chlamydomonas_euryale.AAC.8
MTSSAGIPWDEHVIKLQATSELEAIRTEIEDKNLKYPEFYLKPFHAYDEGNLCWYAPELGAYLSQLACCAG